MNPTTLKLPLAILLFLCLLDMPYGYYQFVRVVATIAFVYLAFTAFEQKNQQELIIFIVLAILFQPLEKFAFGRVLWNIIDVAVGIYLIASLKRK